MKFLLAVFFCFFGYSAPEYLEDGRELVEPEHLFSLLKDKNYDEFNKLLAIDNPKLSIPRDESDKTDPRYNRDIENGDFLMTPEQKRTFQAQGRNAINNLRHPSYRWPNGTIAYVLVESNYTKEEAQFIHNCIAECNAQFNGCVKIVPLETIPPRQRPPHYVAVFSGNGCWSYMGRIGGQQPMSIQRHGCFSCGTICHEFIHAMGFGHEHSREDRDAHLIMRWENINTGWESQFDMAKYPDYMIYLCYDVCSVMHYPRFHPDLCKPGTNAFDYKFPQNINCSHTIGYANKLSDLDTQKICKAYPKQQ